MPTKHPSTQELTLQENVGFFIKSVYQQKYLIALFASLCVFLVYHHFSSQPPVYRTEAKLFIGMESGSKSTITPFGEKLPDKGFGDIHTHQAMFTTRLVAEQTLEDLREQGIDPFPGVGDPPAALLSLITVDIVSGSRILAVTVHNTDPKKAALLANTLVDVYSKILVLKGSSDISESVSMLRVELANLKKRVEIDQTKVKRFELAHPEIREIEAVETQVKAMRVELVGLKSESAQLATQLEDVRELKAQESGRALASYPVIAHNEVIKGIVQRLYQKELDLAKVRKTFQEQYPEVQSLVAEIASLRDLLVRHVDQIVDELKSKRMSVLARTQQLETSVAEGEDQLSDLFNQRVEYKALTGDVEISQQLFDVLSERINQADILGRIGQTPAMVVARATVPGMPYKPQTKRNTLLALLISLAGSMYLAYVYFMTRHTVQRDEDILEYLKLPFLGQLPKVSKGDDLSGTPFEAVEGWAQDSMHLLSQSLLLELSLVKAADNVIVVTSAMNSEGKTFVTANMGVHFGRREKKTLLIGADFRVPRLAQSLDVDLKGRTLYGYLAEKRVSLEEIIHPTSHKNVDLIDNEGTSLSLLKLLDTPRFEDAIKKLSSEYDMIIIDTPPVALFPDAELIARRFPNVLLVVREDTYPCNQIRKNIHRLEGKGIKFLGAMINCRTMPFTLYPGRLYSSYSYYGGLSPIARELRRAGKRIRTRVGMVLDWFFTYTGIYPRHSFLGVTFRSRKVTGQTRKDL